MYINSIEYVTEFRSVVSKIRHDSNGQMDDLTPIYGFILGSIKKQWLKNYLFHLFLLI
jgi:hypothetical protein